MQTLKIIQLIQKPQYRGAELFACQLSNHLVSLGHEVLMVCLYPGEVTLPFNGKIIYLQRPENRRFFDISGWKRFSKIVNSFHPDVIQANAADTLKFAASAKIIFHFQVPIIFRNANKIGDFVKGVFKKTINRIYLTQVSMVLSVSKICRKDFLKTFDFPKNKVKTIQIGVEGEKEKGSGFYIQNLENKKVIVHIGSFVPEKNHKGLLRIFSNVLQIHPEAILLLIGKGALESEIKAEVIKMGLQNTVLFLGNRRDIPGLLKISHCFALPSLIEGLPGVVLEAMYNRVPVVSYEVGGISEILTPETGSPVERNCEDKFVQEVCKVLNTRDERKIQQAFELIDKKFKNDRIAKRFARSYHQLVFKNSPQQVNHNVGIELTKN